MRELQNHSIYNHYKGNLYYTMGIAVHTETGEDMVMYHSLVGGGEGEVFVRPAEMFLSNVVLEDGSTVERFSLVT